MLRHIHTGVSVALALVLIGAACAHKSAPTAGAGSGAASSTSVVPRTDVINPSNVKRVARELPSGYEVSRAIPGDASPRSTWGLGATATTRPSRCAALADPGAGRDHSAQGVSGSGAGGIVEAIVVELRPGPAALDGDLVTACRHWTMAAGRSTAVVTLSDAPPIEGAETLGMVVDIRTSVESGTEIDSRIYTFVAYLGDCYAFTTLTSDPGSALPALPPQFAADLLAKTVAALRS